MRRDAVLMLDEKSVKVTQEWPMTTIRRWLASPTVFTLDFGEYASTRIRSYATDQGLRIHELIAGYIDLIVEEKKRREEEEEQPEQGQWVPERLATLLMTMDKCQYSINKTQDLLNEKRELSGETDSWKARETAKNKLNLYSQVSSTCWHSRISTICLIYSSVLHYQSDLNPNSHFFAPFAIALLA